MVTAAKDKISEVNKKILETKTKQKYVEKRKFNAMDFKMQQAKKKKLNLTVSGRERVK